MRNTLAMFFLLLITTGSFSQKNSAHAASIFLQQNAIQTTDFTKNVLVTNSLSTAVLLSHSLRSLHWFMSNTLNLSEAISNDNEEPVFIGAITSFLKSKDFIYVLVLSFLGFVFLYRLFRKS